MGVEAADVLVGDVGDLFEDQLLGLLSDEFLGKQIRSEVQEQRVAAAQFHVPQ